MEPTSGALWVATLVAAVLFALGYLPYLLDRQVYGPFTPPLLVRVLTIYGVAGVVFGFVYWRYGIEAAMLGHAAGDAVAFAIVTPLL
jgi:membrane protease YdiL (CAAX protease family)